LLNLAEIVTFIAGYICSPGNLYRPRMTGFFLKCLTNQGCLFADRSEGGSKFDPNLRTPYLRVDSRVQLPSSFCNATTGEGEVARHALRAKRTIRCVVQAASHHLMPSKSTHPDRVNAQGIAKISAIDDSLAASAFLCRATLIMSPCGDIRNVPFYRC
jgi:hypothetical protein